MQRELPNVEFVRSARVRAFAGRHGRRMGRDFLYILEAAVADFLSAAVADYNEGRVTLNAELAVRCRQKNRILP
jgi:hypothetical protein